MDDKKLKVTTKRIKSSVVSVKEFVCSDCGSGFKRRLNLLRHVQKLHRPAVCGVCGERVSSMAEHECLGQKLFTCQSCDYRSKRRYDVRRHWEATHSSEARIKIAEKRRRDLRALVREERRKAHNAATRRAMAQEKKCRQDAEKAARKHARAMSKTRAMLSMPCPICKEKFATKIELSSHIEIEHHPTASALEPGTSPDELYGLGKQAFGKTIAEYVKRYEPNVCADPFLLFVDDNSTDILAYHLAKSKIIKLHTHTEILMQHVSDGGDMVNYELFDFYTAPQQLYLRDDLEALGRDVFDEIRRALFERLSNFEDGSGSGWRIKCIEASRIRINKVPHMHEGRSGEQKKRIDAYIRKKFYMPTNLENPLSRDKDCFYAAIAQYFVGSERLKASGKTRIKKMVGKRVEIEAFIAANIDKNIGRPARMSRITQFEEAHRDTLNFKVNVFGHDGSMNSIYPLRPSKREDDAEHTINVLLLELDEGAHYVLIRNIHRTVKRLYHDEAKSNHELCPHCLTVVSGKKALKAHTQYCGLNKPQCVQMPAPGTKMKFKSFNKQFQTGLFAGM